MLHQLRPSCILMTICHIRLHSKAHFPLKVIFPSFADQIISVTSVPPQKEKKKKKKKSHDFPLKR